MKRGAFFERFRAAAKLHGGRQKTLSGTIAWHSSQIGCLPHIERPIDHDYKHHSASSSAPCIP